ncbi:hypothetical protein FRC00_014524 [Tulasnella sp. 408]|nr:hypothetical protein FRC00_014524 [Tulasnella sp. 408]
MENYTENILRTLLYDIAFNRQSLQVDPDSQPAIEVVESDDVERALKPVQRLLHETALSIATKGRNQQPSIPNLPVELFLSIVKNVLADSDMEHDAGYYGQLTELCLVCKDWADTIHNAPELWTQVDLYGSNELIEMVISRSGDSLLDIKGYLGSLFVARIIESEAHRWRSLELQFGDRNLMDNLLSKPAPYLKELTIEGPRDWMAQNNVFEGTVPQLEAVMVQGCGLPWRSPILSDLRKLTLWGIEGRAPQINDLLDILSASPRLNELGIGLTHIQLDTYTPSRRVQLPDLRSLNVKYLYDEIMKAVLNSIDAPLSAACVLCTRPDDEQDMAAGLADVSNRLVALARSVRNGFGTLTLQMGYEDMGGWFNDEEWDTVLKYEPEGDHLGPLSITVNASPEQHVDILNHLAGKVQPYTKSSPPKLRLVDIHRRVPNNEGANLLCALYRTFPNVRDIALIDLKYGAMVDALQRLFPQPGSGVPPLFSRLTTLIIKQRSHEDWAVWLQGHRRRTGKRGGVSPLPRNLTLQLEGGSIDTDGLQALQKLASGTLSLHNVRLEGEDQRTGGQGGRMIYL